MRLLLNFLQQDHKIRKEQVDSVTGELLNDAGKEIHRAEKGLIGGTE